MKKSFITIISCVILIAVTFSIEGFCKEVTKEDLKTKRDKISYSMGLDIGQKLKQREFDLNTWILYKGIKDGFKGEKSLLSDEEMKMVMNAYLKEMQDKMQKKQKAQSGINKAEGEKFLASNKKKKGVKTTKSGLQYKVLRKGSGKKPKSTDSVSVHYEGKLINGTVFDSSYRRKQPFSTPLNRVIKGWIEGLQLMKEGSKFEFYIPSDLAYGPRGSSSGKIGPDSTLIFIVELLKIEKYEKPQSTQRKIIR